MARGKRILVLGLFENYPLDQPVKLKWVVGCADRGPGRILLHLVLEQLSALSKDKRVRLPLVGLKHGNPSAVILTLVGVVDLLLVVQFDGHVLCRLKVRLGNILIELRKLHDQGTVAWGESDLCLQQDTAEQLCGQHCCLLAPNKRNPKGVSSHRRAWVRWGRQDNPCLVLKLVCYIFPILGTNILGNLLLQDLHFVRCRRSSEVQHVALEVLTEANFCRLYSAAGVDVTSAAAWSPAGMAAVTTTASSSPTTYCEE